MAKKAFIISACLLLIVIIISIIISVRNMKPLEFKSVVSYNNTAKITNAPKYETRSSVNDDLPLLSNLIKYEKTIVFSTIFIGFIFVILFYGTKRSKGW